MESHSKNSTTQKLAKLEDKMGILKRKLNGLSFLLLGDRECNPSYDEMAGVSEIVEGFAKDVQEATELICSIKGMTNE